MSTLRTIRKSLNKAYLKLKPSAGAVESFRTGLLRLLEQSSQAESEEFHKNNLRSFLRETYYGSDFYLNTRGRSDLVIHQGKKASTPVGVLIEHKRPENKTEMLRPDSLNRKALQELLLYYLRERITEKNLELRHLIVTNNLEWFIFDARQFENLFARDKKLVQLFDAFERGALAGSKTSDFYGDIAAPAIAAVYDQLSPTYFDLRKRRRHLEKNEIKRLVPLYKILSPEHLLKLPFANDSNSLDRRFYDELLHLIGLTEVKEKGKKLITRPAPAQRHPASLLENTITYLDSRNKLSRVDRPGRFGATTEERLFNLALELCITWVNRVLFLKLLEAQLLSYHRKDPAYRFLTHDLLPDYDALDQLFFEVLAQKPEHRSVEVQREFGRVPYLNSSLFEMTELEHTAMPVSNLLNESELPLHRRTVLRTDDGKTATGPRKTLHYLLDFLDAYDFGSEGGAEVQEDNRTLINASVLGLIFEKINGYRDGSFFTPGFITMYMCRETIRRAVLQKFNEAKGWTCSDFGQLYNRIEDKREANELINSLRLCDPAVGSGHFLVSALNELLAIKNDLGILTDRDGKRLRDYNVTVENDELIVTDEEGNLFEYRPESKESQRVQETLFHEKQTLIENCLFGVDLNPNSVKICRLRLWIELLKHAYYRPGTGERQLETLPNIDINIKQGNSLVSRFDLDTPISKLLKKKKWTVATYRSAVEGYRNAQSKEEKQQFNELIEEIKGDFQVYISQNNRDYRALVKAERELYLRFESTNLFDGEEPRKLNKAERKEFKELSKKVEALKEKIEAVKQAKMFEEAFEWRTEFPEILDDKGGYLGFDIIIGNPPYVRQEVFSDLKPYLQSNYEVYAGTADLLVYFIELGMRNLRPGGHFSFIVANKFMRAGFGKALRNYLQQFRLLELIDFGDLPVFEEATTYPLIVSLQRTEPTGTFHAANVPELRTMDFPAQIVALRFESLQTALTEDSWNLTDKRTQQLLEKLKNTGVPLGEYVNGEIYYGIKTGYNKAFVIDAATRAELIAADPKSAEVIKPFLAGRDVKRYVPPVAEKYLILFEKGWTKAQFGEAVQEAKAFNKLSEAYPAVSEHLKQFETLAKKRYDQGDFWWELRACDYYGKFEKGKIMFPDISLSMNATYSISEEYGVNTLYIIPTENLGLLGYLNSSLFSWMYAQLSPAIRGGYLRFIRQYVELMPVVDMGSVAPVVKQILELREREEDSSGLEAEVDRLVCELYNLTSEEIELIENA